MYQSKGLSVMACTNDFTLWHYTTTDAATTVDTSGYFNPAVDILRSGDVIMANCNTGGSKQFRQLHVDFATEGRVETSVVARTGE
jgi:hypothetical protein